MRVLAMAAAVVLAASTALAGALPAAAASVTRQQLLDAAARWLTAGPGGGPVPYSSDTTFETYRTDCSGYVFMAARLPAPGERTVELAGDGLSMRIEMHNLMRGDIIVDSTGLRAEDRHVVIFEKWTSSSRTSYWAYEQRYGRGTDHRILTYGLEAGSEYKPRRLKNVTGQ